MSEEQKPAPEATPTPAPETPVVVDPPVESVPKAEFEKVLAELHKHKNEKRELLAKSQAEKEQILREQNRWQELAELKAKEAEELREYSTKAKEAFVSEKKYSALKEAALKAGIRPEALPDLEIVGLDKVQVETTSTGRVNVLGVEHAIENLKLQRPHWFGGQKTVIAGNTPNVMAGAIVNTEQLDKLSKEAAKTGDYTAYQEATKLFQQQKRKV
jgi:hypothetical protein